MQGEGPGDLCIVESVLETNHISAAAIHKEFCITFSRLFAIMSHNLLHCMYNVLYILIGQPRIKRNTHDGIIKGFCLRTYSHLISQLLIEPQEKPTGKGGNYGKMQQIQGKRELKL